MNFFQKMPLTIAKLQFSFGEKIADNAETVNNFVQLNTANLLQKWSCE